MATKAEGDPLLDAVLALSRALVAVTAKSLGQLNIEVTLTQYRTLVVLASSGPQRTAQLAAQLGVKPSTVTRLCDRLVQRGWVRRHPGETDRRTVLIVLTPAGKQLVGLAMRQRRKMLASLVTGIPARQAQTAAKVMTHLAQQAGELPDASWWARWARSTAL